MHLIQRNVIIFLVAMSWKQLHRFEVSPEISYTNSDKEEPKVSKWEFLNDFTIEEIRNIMRPTLEKTQSEGSVPVRNLSSNIRKKESAGDSRESSQGIGILGGCLLGFVFILIFVSDIFILKVHLTAMYRNLHSALTRSKVKSPWWCVKGSSNMFQRYQKEGKHCNYENHLF